MWLRVVGWLDFFAFLKMHLSLTVIFSQVVWALVEGIRRHTMVVMGRRLGEGRGLIGDSRFCVGSWYQGSNRLRIRVDCG